MPIHSQLQGFAMSHPFVIFICLALLGFCIFSAGVPLMNMYASVFGAILAGLSLAFATYIAFRD